MFINRIFFFVLARFRNDAQKTPKKLLFTFLLYELWRRKNYAQ